MNPMSLIARGQPHPLRLRRLPGPFDPLAAFAPFAAEPGAVLLHSALPHARFGRHTLWAARPVAVLEARGGEVVLRRREGEERLSVGPFQAVDALLAEFRRPPVDLPIPFAGGLIGYFGYDLGRALERIPATARKDDGFPDLWLGLYDAAVALDALAGEAWLAGREGLDAREALDRRMADLADAAWAASLNSPTLPPSHSLTLSPSHSLTLSPSHSLTPSLSDSLTPSLSQPLSSNFTRAAYLDAIARAKSHIAAGDIYQVNLSQRFEARLDTRSPYDLYRRLAAASPAPFASFLNLGDGRAVASASPERFLRLDGRRVETRPIKGTRPRGATPAEDARLRAELEASEKDRAELVMIVDLERNDLGRVCAAGSVEVAEARVIETYAQVHHGVAAIRGTLREGAGAADLLRAAFPGGSITGAPKVRAMEIIEALEPTRRSVYTGAIGYLGLDGRMDLAIAIRTMLVEGARATFQAGGGIVADSDPEAEYEETRVKARGLAAALGLRLPDCADPTGPPDGRPPISRIPHDG
jgi:para-aminobenzoate synthetase component 1